MQAESELHSTLATLNLILIKLLQQQSKPMSIYKWDTKMQFKTNHLKIESVSKSAKDRTSSQMLGILELTVSGSPKILSFEILR